MATARTTIEPPEVTGPEAVPVHVAIARVIRDMPAIGKGDRAPENMGGFQYRGIERMTAAIQPLLARHGVVIIPQAQDIEVSHAPGSKEAWQDVRIKFDWLVIGPAGDHFTASTYGIGRDHTDKGANKAQSQAFKYLLLAMFCVSDPKDDADAHDYSSSAADRRDDPTRPVPNEVEADQVCARVAKVAKLPGGKDALRDFGGINGKGFGGEALLDPAWRAAVVAKLNEIEAKAAAPPEVEGGQAALDMTTSIGTRDGYEAEYGYGK